MRFGIQNRLRLAREIEFLKQNSMKADCSAFIIYLYPRPLNQPSRIAIIASKRVGNAVVRNNARRIFREVFRACATSFSSPIDILVFVRRGYFKFSLDSLKNKFLEATQRISKRFPPQVPSSEISASIDKKNTVASDVNSGVATSIAAEVLPNNLKPKSES